MSKIELRRIDESNFIDCFNLKLKKEQEEQIQEVLRKAKDEKNHRQD